MLEERFQELEALLSDGDIITDQTKYRELSKEYAELEPVVKTIPLTKPLWLICTQRPYW